MSFRSKLRDINTFGVVIRSEIKVLFNFARFIRQLKAMNGNKLSPIDYQIFLFKALLWLTLAWVGFALALAGFFYASVAWGIAILSGLLLVKLEIKHRLILRLSREMWIASFAILAVALVFSAFTTPTVFPGAIKAPSAKQPSGSAKIILLLFRRRPVKRFFSSTKKDARLIFQAFITQPADSSSLSFLWRT